MEKNKVVRWQLMALAAITVVLLVRVISGPPSPDGLVVMDDLDAHELHEEAFSLVAPTRLAIHAVGAYDHRAGEAKQLAAQAWILDRESRQPVWRMDPSSNTVAGRGLLAQSDDSLVLPAGEYEVYFASYGGFLSGSSLGQQANTLFDRLLTRQRWQDDSRRWQVVIGAVDDGGKGAKAMDREARPTITSDELLWEAKAVGNAETRYTLFRLNEAVSLNVRATGEITSEVNDTGWIEDVSAGQKVWQMTADRTRHAGGAPENRTISESVDLPAGIYRAVYRTDQTHAYADWLANPPFDPRSWGMSLTLAHPAQRAAIKTIDPWTDGVPLVAMDRVGNDAFKVTYFTVDAPTVFMVYSMGELTEHDRFDYGWVERVPANRMGSPGGRDASPDPSNTLWEITYAASQHAGGSDDNREQFDVVRLEPGGYALYYVSDYAHAHGDWRRDRARNAERWGITLLGFRSDAPQPFAIQSMFDLNPDAEMAEEDWPEPELPAEPAPPPMPAIAALPQVPGDMLVSLTSIGSNESREVAFELSGKTVLHVRAMGEISLSGGLYDYGQILREDDRTVVWSMSRDNTSHAGGGNANRMFEGEIVLEAGRYLARYETDGTHAFGDFDNDPPSHPEAWGLVISRVQVTP